MSDRCNSEQLINVVEQGDKLRVFQDIINKSGSSLVYAFFYNPSCPPCRHMIPIFESYREACSRSSSKPTLIAISHDTAKELFPVYEVASWPQLLVFERQNLKHRIVGADEQKWKKVFALGGMNL